MFLLAPHTIHILGNLYSSRISAPALPGKWGPTPPALPDTLPNPKIWGGLRLTRVGILKRAICLDKKSPIFEAKFAPKPLKSKIPTPERRAGEGLFHVESNYGSFTQKQPKIMHNAGELRREPTTCRKKTVGVFAGG